MSRALHLLRARMTQIEQRGREDGYWDDVALETFDVGLHRRGGRSRKDVRRMLGCVAQGGSSGAVLGWIDVEVEICPILKLTNVGQLATA